MYADPNIIYPKVTHCTWHLQDLKKQRYWKKGVADEDEKSVVRLTRRVVWCKIVRPSRVNHFISVHPTTQQPALGHCIALHWCIHCTALWNSMFAHMHCVHSIHSSVQQCVPYSFTLKICTALVWLWVEKPKMNSGGDKCAGAAGKKRSEINKCTDSQ